MALNQLRQRHLNICGSTGAADERRLPNMNQVAALHCPSGFASFLAELELGGPLSPDERDSLQIICEHRRRIPAHRDIISDGDRPDHVHVMLEGWAARYKILP